MCCLSVACVVCVCCLFGWLIAVCVLLVCCLFIDCSMFVYWLVVVRVLAVLCLFAVV